MANHSFVLRLSIKHASLNLRKIAPTLMKQQNFHNFQKQYWQKKKTKQNKTKNITKQNKHNHHKQCSIYKRIDSLGSQDKNF